SAAELRCTGNPHQPGRNGIEDKRKNSEQPGEQHPAAHAFHKEVPRGVQKRGCEDEQQCCDAHEIPFPDMRSTVTPEAGPPAVVSRKKRGPPGWRTPQGKENGGCGSAVGAESELT